MKKRDKRMCFYTSKDGEEAIKALAEEWGMSQSKALEKCVDLVIQANLRPLDPFKTGKGHILSLSQGEAAAFDQIGTYTAENGRQMVNFAAVLNLWQGDLETLRRLADLMPDINGRRPTIAEIYHACATKGLHQMAEAMAIKTDTAKREA